MNTLIKYFFAIFVVFIVILLLNVIVQLGTPLVGDYNAILTNFINSMAYIMLIFGGLFWLSRR